MAVETMVLDFLILLLLKYHIWIKIFILIYVQVIVHTLILNTQLRMQHPARPWYYDNNNPRCFRCLDIIILNGDPRSCLKKFIIL